MTAGSLLRISARRRAGAGAALLVFAAITAPSTAKAFSTDATAAAQVAAQAAAAAAGPVSTAATGARCIGPAFDDTPAFQAAIDTGHTVYAPALGGECHITHALAMKTPGQIFFGDGRARTKIVIAPGFAGEGVFVAKTGEPGPVWRDFSVSFVQPDVDDRARLNRYPPAFFAPDTPRFEMEHLGCYVATACIDMKGNSGGATIADLQMSAFEVGIDIDGSLDTVRITDPHWWPFLMSNVQQKVFYDQSAIRSTAINSGRADNLIISGGLFLGGLAVNVYGATAGTISTTDFDSGAGIVLRSGALQISSSEFILGLPKSQAIVQTGGAISISSSIFAGPSSPNALILLAGGALIVTGCSFSYGAADLTSVEESGENSRLILMADLFTRQPNVSYDHPTINLHSGRSTIIGNVASDKGRGSGRFLIIDNDNPFNMIMNNSSPGWPDYTKIK